MSEVLERLRGVRQIPLFPLPLVMLPNELLPLHIFEERYRKMLRDVESGNHLFGITLFEPDASIAEKPAVGTVGCVARSGGRDAARRPFQYSRHGARALIDCWDTSTRRAVLHGRVAFFEDEDENSERLQPLADEVFELFGRMARAAFKMSGGRGTSPEIKRADPEALSFLITAAFNFENDKKYASRNDLDNPTPPELNRILLKPLTKWKRPPISRRPLAQWSQ
jgi:Lon protease-like protein